MFQGIPGGLRSASGYLKGISRGFQGIRGFQGKLREMSKVFEKRFMEFRGPQIVSGAFHGFSGGCGGPWERFKVFQGTPGKFQRDSGVFQEVSVLPVALSSIS